MSEEKLVPKLRFSGFDDEWKSFKLNEVGNIVTGATPPTKDNDNFINSGYLWVTPGDISSKKVVSKTERNLSEKGLKNGRKLDPNSILVTCIGATIGKLCMINEIGSCNQQLNAISANKNFYPDFIYYVIQKTAKNLILIAGNTATPILNKKSFGNLSYIFPSFNEQKKIALFLDKIDKKRELLEKKYEFYQDFKKYLMQQIFTQKLRFDFNEKWKVYKLKDLLSVKSSNISINKVDNNTGEYPLYGTGGYLQNIDFYEMEDEYISITKDGSVGKIDYHEGKSSIINTSQYLIPNKNFNIRFLYYQLQTLNFEKYIVGSSIPHIYFKDYGNEKVKIPNLLEQEIIAKLFIVIDKKLYMLDKSISLMYRFKKGLLQQMFI